MLDIVVLMVGARSMEYKKSQELPIIKTLYNALMINNKKTINISKTSVLVIIYLVT